MTLSKLFCVFGASIRIHHSFSKHIIHSATSDSFSKHHRKSLAFRTQKKKIHSATSRRIHQLAVWVNAVSGSSPNLQYICMVCRTPLGGYMAGRPSAKPVPCIRCTPKEMTNMHSVVVQLQQQDQEPHSYEGQSRQNTKPPPIQHACTRYCTKGP